MKPVRNKNNLRKGLFKSRSASLNQDPVEVFCRIRPLRSGPSCIEALSATTLKFSPPDSTVSYRNANNVKELHCTFTRVFDERAMQPEVFQEVALPLVTQLISGKNGLLFTYGVTGGGKTYTMTGESYNPGIMPRCLNLLFKAIANHQARRHVFKPDKMNGFEIQDDDEVALACRSEPIAIKTPKTPRRREADLEFIIGSDENIPESLPIDEENVYSCFVSYVEIYNNSVFDLLDSTEEAITRKLQNKVVREDGNRNMYVHGVTEVEVKSPEEAFEVFSRGQKRKKVAYTILNDVSSRSHSVFTIRLVQAPIEVSSDDISDQKRFMTISQLSLVDLAGSERTNKTKNTGQRLREAGSINNSLMTLRSCIEILRENQKNKENKIVPYRDSKLTHLFKNYFDGEGAVRMVICVNPRAEDYDETVHVLRFAELSQEIQVTRPTPQRQDVASTKGFKRRILALKRSSDENCEGTPAKMSVPYFQPLPTLTLHEDYDENTFASLEIQLEQIVSKYPSLLNDARDAEISFRRELLKQESEFILSRQEIIDLKGMLEFERNKNIDNVESWQVWEREKNDWQVRVKESELRVQQLLAKMEEKDQQIRQLSIEKEIVKEKCINKIGQRKERFRRELETRIQQTKDVFEEALQQKDEKIRHVKEVLAETTLFPPRTVRRPEHPVSVNSHGTFYQGPSTPVVTSRGPAVCNIRHRRSRSAEGDRWLDHRPTHPVGLNTVFQPRMNKLKSVSKLVDVKDVVNPKTSKYCLTTQEQDGEGDLETRLYKGDVIPTCSGGAQVILNDVETLRQSSPTNIETRKRSVPDERTEERCRVSIEGHSKRPRS